MSRYATDIPTLASKEGHDGRQRNGQPDRRSPPTILLKGHLLRGEGSETTANF